MSNRIPGNSGIGIEVTGASNTIKANKVDNHPLGGIKTIRLRATTSQENDVFSNGTFGIQVNSRLEPGDQERRR